MDVAQNSIKAEATEIRIVVDVRPREDTLTIVIEDNGKGMSKEQVEAASDPFFTTRTTRRVGLGIPFFREGALMSGGDFSIRSEPGKGTCVTAVFGYSHIDRMPLGDMCSTIHTLITLNTQIRFLYTYRYDGKEFSLDTLDFSKILGDIPLNAPEVSSFIADYLSENQKETDGGAVY